MKPPIILAILDGFGLANQKNNGNAVTSKTAPFIFSAMDKYPTSVLKASGVSVGLRKGQPGNSEAGHLNIGTGRIVKQDLSYISDAIDSGEFFENEAFDCAIKHAKKNKSSTHLMGLLTGDKSAHAQIEHLIALLQLLKKRNVKRVHLHLFMDGRDTAPFEGLELIKRLQKHITKHQTISTIIGRFYAMDRAKNWERTQKAYHCLVTRKCPQFDTVEEALADAYADGESDEFVSPRKIGGDGRISDGDAIIFFNARSDRARQLAKTFVQRDFKKRNPKAFKRSKVVRNLCFVAMTDFGPDLPLIRAFPSPNFDNAIAKAVGETRKQLYISEQEKYAHITYFINGGFAKPVNGEKREFVTSLTKKHIEMHPELKTKEVTKKVLDYLKNKTYDFIVVNFPNADMLGHTGNIEAAKKGITYMDKEVERVAKQVLKQNGLLIITADHGNAEEMIDKKTGEVQTEHTCNDVPCIFISNNKKLSVKKTGILADIAPTVLQWIEKPKPKEMTGRSLIK